MLMQNVRYIILLLFYFLYTLRKQFYYYVHRVQWFYKYLLKVAYISMKEVVL